MSATTFVPVLPSFDGFFQQTSDAATKAGKQAGDDLAKSLERSLASAEKRLNSVSSAHEKAQNKAATATEKRELAETKLEQVLANQDSTAAQVQKAQNDLAKARRDETTAANDAERAASNLESAQKDLARAQQEFNDASQTSGDALGKWALSADEAEQASRDLETAQKALDGAMLGIIGMAGAAGGALFALGNDFDHMRSELQIATGATGDALESLENSARTVATTVPVSFEEAGAAIGTLNTLTGESGESLDYLTQQVLNTSHMLGEDGVANAEAYGKALKQWGLDAEAGAAAMDGIFTVTQDYGVGFDALTKNLNKFGPVLKNAGFQMEEAAVLFGSLESAGISVSRIMPGMNAAFRKWAGENKNVQEELAGTVAKIEGAETAQEALNIATDTFGAEGAQRLTTAIRNGSFDLRDFQEALGDTAGAVARTAEETRSFEDNLTLFGNRAKDAFEPLATEIFNAVIPALDDLAVTAEKAFEWITENKETIVTVAKFLGGFAAGLYAVRGAMMAVEVAARAKNVALLLANGGFKTLDKTVKRSYIGILAGIVIGVATALHHFFTQTETGKKLWENFTKALASGWEWFTGALSDGWNWINENVFTPFMEWIDGIGDDWDEFTTALGDAWDGLTGALSDGWNWVKDAVFAAWEWYIGEIKSNWETFTTVISSAWDGLTGALADGWNWIKEAVFNAWTAAVDAVKLVWDTTTGAIVDAWQWVGDRLAAILFGIRDAVFFAFEYAANSLKAVWNGVTEGLVMYWEWVSEKFTAVWNWIKDSIFAAWEWSANQMQQAWDQVSNKIVEAWQWVSDTFASVWEWIKTQVMDVFVATVEWVREQFSKVTNSISESWQWLSDQLGRVWNWIDEHVFASMRTGLDVVRNAFDVAVNAIRDLWDGIRAAAARPVKFVIERVFNDGIVEAWNKVAGWVNLPEVGKYQPSWLGGFARGTSRVPGPRSVGRDNVHFLSTDGRYGISLAGGEGILRQEAVDELGPHEIDGLNAAARMGGRAGVRRYLGGYSSGGVISSITDVVNRNFPMMTITSTFRQGDPGYHGKGLAVDFSNGFDSTPQMRQATKFFHDNWGPGLLQLIHSPSPWNIGNGQNVGDGFGFYGAGTMAEHRNHVHVASPTPLGDERTMVEQIGNFLGGVVRRGRRWIAEQIGKIMDPIGNLIPGENFGGLIGGIPRAIFDKMKDTIVDFIGGKAEESAVAGAAGSAESWRPMAKSLMGRYGFDPSNKAQVDAMIAQIQSESGGDPNIAQQIVDVNGTGESAGVGLLQIIPGTFAAYRDPALPNDRRDPEANMAAALRYYRARYGTDLTTMWGKGHGYAGGGILDFDRLRLYDTGGVLRHGDMAVNLSGAAEAVLTSEQWAIFERAVAAFAQGYPEVAGAIDDAANNIYAAAELWDESARAGAVAARAGWEDELPSGMEFADMALEQLGLGDTLTRGLFDRFDEMSQIARETEERIANERAEAEAAAAAAAESEQAVSEQRSDVTIPENDGDKTAGENDDARPAEPAPTPAAVPSEDKEIVINIDGVEVVRKRLEELTDGLNVNSEKLNELLTARRAVQAGRALLS